ncbi:MAG: hypothetical protein V1735_02080 [Nanoarchaeota archaeon]
MKSKKKPKTIQIGLRVDLELLRDIEELAEDEGVDKMSWIRRALALAVIEEKEEMSQMARKDFVCLKIDEKDLLEITESTKVPEDLKRAREEYLKKISSAGKE